MKIDGACYCGAITFEADVNSESVAICHCTDCQTTSGTAFRTIVPASAETFRVVSGEPKTYLKTGGEREPASVGVLRDVRNPRLGLRRRQRPWPHQYPWRHGAPARATHSEASGLVPFRAALARRRRFTAGRREAGLSAPCARSRTGASRADRLSWWLAESMSVNPVDRAGVERLAVRVGRTWRGSCPW